MSRPVVVFQGHNEFEAQMARDVLQSAMIPVLHLPSLSTGVFGVPQTERVAVPEEYVEAALSALEEAGLPGTASEPPRGLAAFSEAANRILPRPVSGTQAGRLQRMLQLLAILIAVLALAWLLLSRKP